MQTLNVVVGVIKKQSLYLFTKRPAGKIYEHYWEFPGGKIEANETKTAALKRELFEELNIIVNDGDMQFIYQFFHKYKHAHVNLYFYLIQTWENDFFSNEQQEFLWANINSIPYPILPSLENILPNLLI